MLTRCQSVSTTLTVESIVSDAFLIASAVLRCAAADKKSPYQSFSLKNKI
jgi:hypothetical protein